MIFSKSFSTPSSRLHNGRGLYLSRLLYLVIGLSWSTALLASGPFSVHEESEKASAAEDRQWIAEKLQSQIAIPARARQTMGARTLELRCSLTEDGQLIIHQWSTAHPFWETFLRKALATFRESPEPSTEKGSRRTYHLRLRFR